MLILVVILRMFILAEPSEDAACGSEPDAGANGSKPAQPVDDGHD